MASGSRKKAWGVLVLLLEQSAQAFKELAGREDWHAFFVKKIKVPEIPCDERINRGTYCNFCEWDVARIRQVRCADRSRNYLFPVEAKVVNECLGVRTRKTKSGPG